MSALLTDVAARLRQHGVPDPVAQLALAACRGEDALAAAAAAEPSAAAPAEHDAATPPPRPVHLAAIEVTGFRGIGATATLDLAPTAGLTLVVGRNGSGKSSFAEAIEFAMTGDNRRWSTRSKVWRDGWRNLHHSGPAEVAGRFVVDGEEEPVTVAQRWAADAGLDAAQPAVSGPLDIDDLGWSQALELHRPFLPYSELGAMVDDGPTALHDALSAVLGLDVLTSAGKALKDARLHRERQWKAVVAAGATVAAELREVDDDRARRAVALLTAKQADVEAVAGLLGDGAVGDDPGLDILRQLATLAGPDLDAVRLAADHLDDAARNHEGVRGTDAARDLELAALLADARAFHLTHGDSDCPVCGAGGLDATWRARAEVSEAELRKGAEQVTALARDLDVARREVAAQARAVPAILRRAGAADLDASLATTTWDALAAVVAEPDDRERAVALRRTADAVTEALADLRSRARTHLLEREDRWRPHATRVAAWVDGAEQAREALTPVEDLRAAEKALAVVLDQIRAERWEPIAAQARAIWEQLRASSNVAIEDVALTGSGTRRRVEVSVTVDGIEGAALGVMSQGELHALALSLFLPRATLDESPFRFLVIDDPVQSMDPARVAGLSQVLQSVARDRQVIVFTHDDRLVDAVREQGVEATVIEVVRGSHSAVEVRPIG